MLSTSRLSLEFIVGRLASSSNPSNTRSRLFLESRRCLQWWPETPSMSELVMPPKIEDRKIPLLPYTPILHPENVVPPIKHPRADIDMRGPERVHNQLVYRQFGIIALGGGSLKGAHFDVIRDRINKYLDFERFFAIWRVDPPWKAVSKRSQGKRAGGGKSKVHHYETPVRAGRILIEVAGRGHYGEVERVLTTISKKMPFYATAMNQEWMDELKEEKLKLMEENMNPFEYRDLVRRDISDCKRRLPPVDALWGGTYF